jgi:hypothetical protein
MARIGSTSPWSWRTVLEGWTGAVRGSRRRIPAGRAALLATFAIALTAGSVFAGVQALSQVPIVGQPQVTPWARVGGTRPPVITANPSPSDAAPSASPSVLPDATPSASPSASAGPTPTLMPTGTPGPFSMDLYPEGAFVGEYKDTWCVPAAMQTMTNIMNIVPDTTRDTQAQLFDLAVSISGSAYGGTDPIGWAKGLTSLGYGNYEVGAKAKMADVIHLVARQIRVTQRPAGLLVWYGWHSWVVSGFTATADPALTDSYTVTSLRIEDVWYPRHSNLWGDSRPPDSDVPVAQLPKDYKIWHQGKYIAGREGLFVYVIPVE